jgi:hypothetical protein
MTTSINLPPNILEALQALADKSHLSLETVMIDVLEKALAARPAAAQAARSGNRVNLPIIRSSHPGSLHSLSGTQVDDLLG